jgi:hypothetical protein
MSSDRLTEILNFLSAISRDIGAFRTETSARLDRLEADMSALRTDVRALTIRFDRDHAVVFDTRADVRELEDRVAALEGKQT